jgi:hypothetical protein
MADIRAIYEDESGEFVIFDDSNKIRVEIKVELIQDQSHITTSLTADDAKNFYSRHIDIVEKNKSENKNINGYFESTINSNDFK